MVLLRFTPNRKVEGMILTHIIMSGALGHAANADYQDAVFFAYIFEELFRFW